MYQEQFFLTSKWIVMLLTIILICIQVFVKSKKYSKFLIIISVIIALIGIYMLFVINKQPKIPLVKPGQILSPSSGYIGDIHYHKNGQTTIMFILSFFDNHIQYIPYNGKIIKNEYVQSKYLKPKRVFILDPRLFPNFEESIRDNEQYQTTLSTDIGNMYITRIAGIVAPRVHSFINNNWLGIKYVILYKRYEIPSHIRCYILCSSEGGYIYALVLPCGRRVTCMFG